MQQKHKLKPKDNFNFQHRKSSSGTLGVNYIFFSERGERDKKGKNPCFRSSSLGLILTNRVFFCSILIHFSIELVSSSCIQITLNLRSYCKLSKDTTGTKIKNEKILAYTCNLPNKQNEIITTVWNNEIEKKKNNEKNEK